MAIIMMKKSDRIRVRTPGGMKLVMLADIERMLAQQEQIPAATEGEQVFDPELVASAAALDALPPKEKLDALRELDDGVLVDSAVFKAFLVKKPRRS